MCFDFLYSVYVKHVLPYTSVYIWLEMGAKHDVGSRVGNVSVVGVIRVFEPKLEGVDRL
jgi:hypothetical protein